MTYHSYAMPIPTDELIYQRRLEEANARLLAVARAAYAYDYCMDEDTERKDSLLLKMRKALKEVEHLLEVSDDY